MKAMRSTRPATVLRGVLALAAIVALTLGVPVLLLAMIGNPIPHQWSWDQPLTNDAILGVVACAAWLLWAQLAICVAVETIAEIRLAAGGSADWLSRVPGTFTGQQAMARTLVQAVVALGITSGTVAAAPTAWTAHAHAATFAEPTQNTPTATPISKATSQATSGTRPAPSSGPTTESTAGRSAAPAVNPKQIPTATVEVRRGDTLWSIAETHLGAGERWRQIAVLNHGRRMADGQRFLDADRIRPGWVLLIPEPIDQSGAHGTNTETQAAGVNGARVVTVRPGDSLWGIAERDYGVGDLWPRIYQANRGQILDPDVIHTGQHLTVPQQTHKHSTKQAAGQPPTRATPPASRHRTRQVETPGQHRLPPTPPSFEPPFPPPAPTPSAEQHGHRSVGSSSGQESDTGEESAVLSTLARTLAGGGMLLGGCLAAAYTARRRAQSRVRRSGRTIPRTRPELVDVEADVRSAGLAGGEAVAFLDRALRDLSARASRLPDVAAVRLTETVVELVLNEPLSPAPDGWHVEAGVEGGGPRWRLPRSHPLSESSGPAPYPTLVTVGLDPDGGTWLIDLEAAGLIQLDGPASVCDDVLRFLAAELGTNRWSDVVKVWVAGLGPDLVRLNPGRLNLLEHAEVEPLVNKTRGVAEIRDANHLDVLTGRGSLDSGDAWNPLLILTATSAATSDAAAEEFLQARQGERSATAWVTTGGARPGGLRIVVDQEGYAALPWVDHVLVNRLSVQDARAIGAAFAGAEDLHDEPMPVGPLAEVGPVAGLADEAGALRDELTSPRPAEGSARSVLPELNAAYLEAAATTVEDLNTLTPQTPPGLEDTVRAADPHLETDLAEWLSGTLARPQLRLLGPIELRVDRPVPAAAHRRVAYLTEVAAYLACHPDGVTATRLADAFGVQATTVHKRIQELRDWLGEDPATGTQRLPEAKLSQPGTARGVGNYVLTDVLCDFDLFRRLRVRGQARGANGIEDLTAALGLVTGPPFDQQRPHGYGWLASDPTDHHLTAAIVDVAHIVATAALTAGEAERAAWAATQATAVAPFEDTPHLDYAAALEAMGHPVEANAHLDREVYNRSDDDLAPPDPTARVTQVAARQQQRPGQISAPTSRPNGR